MRAKINYKSPKSRIPRGRASSPLINAHCFQQIGKLKSENLPSSKMFSCYKDTVMVSRMVASRAHGKVIINAYFDIF
jgi:hypothetical protein